MPVVPSFVLLVAPNMPLIVPPLLKVGDVIDGMAVTALVADSGGRAKLLTVDGAGHDNIHDFAAYRDTLARRLTELGASPLKADRP